MPIEFDRSILESFFETELKIYPPADHGVTCEIDYVGNVLKYNFIFCGNDDIVSVSGDPDHPFCADSFFEINIPCDSITEIADGYYPGKTGLAFWYGDTGHQHNMTMMLLKAPKGDLKVWPNCPWPTRHAGHKMHADAIDGEPYAS